MTNGGLALFVLVQALNVAGLLLDLWLLSQGIQTVTQHVWRWPLLGLPLVAIQGLACGGLVVHFYGQEW
jgi:hypothetical protein